jgi:cytochrome c-type biogenesis protein CcmH/NrfG
MQGARIRRAVMVSTFMLGLAFVAMPVEAQTGQVKGKVVDAKEQPVEGAVITIESIDSGGGKRTVKSNRRGEFLQIGLQPGQYKLTAEKEGLSDTMTRKVGLDATEVNFSLRPGGSAAGGEASAEERKKAEARIAAVQANFNAGVELSKAGKHDEAIAKYNEVLATAPKCVECFANIAASHMAKKDYDQAEAAYKKWIEVAPTSAEAYSGLASLYNAQKKFDLAGEASAQAQKLGSAAPGGMSASAMFNQGVIAWNASKIPEAKKSFEDAVKLDPKFADAHYWLGMANLNEGKMPEAAASLEEYLKLAPTGQYAEQTKGILASIKK